MTDRIRIRLTELEAAGRHPEIRGFACWLALQTAPNTPVWHRAVRQVQENLGTPRTDGICYKLREDMRSAVVAAAIMGLKYSPGPAQAVLTCAACFRESPMDAAQSAYSHAEAWFAATMPAAHAGLFERRAAEHLRAIE